MAYAAASAAAAARKLPEVNKLYRYTQPTILDDRLRSLLPEPYKKFYREWKLTIPSPVHYVERAEKWERDPDTGLTKPVQNIPILPRYPNESDKGLWGGEGIVVGYNQKQKRFAVKNAHFWFPILKRSVVYSEILDKYMTIVVTKRTIDLILDNHGLDHYLLKTKAHDIQSELGVKLKRKMLMALLNKDLYPNDKDKQEFVYNKYKHYLDDYSKEDIEWYGLTIYEAFVKMDRDQDAIPPQPLKHQFRKQIFQELKQELLGEVSEQRLREEQEASSNKSWLSKINPFAGSKK